MKKIFAIVLTLALVLSMGTMSAFAATTGSGTASDPYVITEAIDLFTNYASGDYVKLANDITSENGLVIGDEELTIDLDGHTLTLPHIILTGSAVLNVSGGTITSAAYPTAHVQNMITLNDTSVLNAESMYLLAGKEDDMNMAPYAVCPMQGTKANLTNCYVKGGDSDATAGDFMAPGVPLVTNGGTITLSDCTLAMGDGGDWVTNASCPIVEIYNNGILQDKNNNAITPAVFSASDIKEQKIGTGYPATTVDKNTITSVASGSNAASADVKGTYVAGSASNTVYSVDVTWGSMEFTYTDGSNGTWNPDTHAYDGATEGAWTNATDANKITVTNHSNDLVVATLSYDAGTSYTGITGEFTLGDGKYTTETIDGSRTVQNEITLDDASTVSASNVTDAPYQSFLLSLKGELASGTAAKTTLGTVTVTITNDDSIG